MHSHTHTHIHTSTWTTSSTNKKQNLACPFSKLPYPRITKDNRAWTRQPGTFYACMKSSTRWQTRKDSDSSTSHEQANKLRNLHILRHGILPGKTTFTTKRLVLVQLTIVVNAIHIRARTLARMHAHTNTNTHTHTHRHTHIHINHSHAT